MKKQTYPKNDPETLKDTIQKLKSQIRRLQKEVKTLRYDNVSLVDAWAKTEAVLAEMTEDISLEDILKHKNMPNKVKRKVKVKDQSNSQEETRKKWQNWQKENL